MTFFLDRIQFEKMDHHIKKTMSKPQEECLPDQLCLILPSPLWFELLLLHNSCTLHCTAQCAHCTVKKKCARAATSVLWASVRPLAPDQLMMGIEQIKVNQTLQFIAASTKLVMSLQHCEQERLY